MLTVSAVEEAELLLAVGGIVGGVEVEQNLPALADLLAAEADELLADPVVAVHQLAGGRRVLPAAEGGLGAERIPQFVACLRSAPSSDPRLGCRLERSASG